MAIKKCPDCNGKVSDTVKTCPHCGRSMTFGRQGLEGAKDTVGAVWSLFWIALSLLLLVGMCSAIIN